MKRFLVFFTIFTVAICAFFGFRAMQGAADGREDVLANIPVDTPFFIGGYVPEQQASRTAEKPFLPAWLEKKLRESNAVAAKNAFDQLLEALRQELLAKVHTNQDLENELGISRTGFQAVYWRHGGPVYSGYLSDEAKFEQFVKQLAERSGVELEKRQVNGAEYEAFTAELENASGQPATFDQLAISHRNGRFYIAFVNAQDADDVVADRLGLTPVEQSMQSVDQLASITTETGLQNANLWAFVSYENLLEHGDAFLDKEYEKEAANYEPGAELWSPQCRPDLKKLVHQFPQLSVALNTYANEGNKLIWRSHLKIRSKVISDGLNQLQGTLPNYVDGSELLNAAVGVNTMAFQDVANSWKQALQQETFSCDLFKEMQGRVAQLNPGMASFVVGALGGLKGVSLSVWVDETKDEKAILDSLSVVLDIAADNPQTLAMTLNGVLATRGAALTGRRLSLPTGAEPVPLDLSAEIPAGEVMAQIKGKHLVIYHGKRAKTVVASLSDKLHANDGFWNLSVDMGKVARIGLRQPRVKGAIDDTLGAEMDDEKLLRVLAAQNLKLAYRAFIVPSGYSEELSAQKYTAK